MRHFSSRPITIGSRSPRLNTTETHTELAGLPVEPPQALHPDGEGNLQGSAGFNAHQVNNLLFAITASVEALQAKHRVVLANDPLVENLLVASRRLQDLLTGLLQKAKVHGGEDLIGPGNHADAAYGALEATMEPGSQ